MTQNSLISNEDEDTNVIEELDETSTSQQSI